MTVNGVVFHIARSGQNDSKRQGRQSRRLLASQELRVALRPNCLRNLSNRGGDSRRPRAPNNKPYLLRGRVYLFGTSGRNDDNSLGALVTCFASASLCSASKLLAQLVEPRWRFSPSTSTKQKTPPLTRQGLFVWYQWADSNRHSRRNQILNLACLPISPHWPYLNF